MLKHEIRREANTVQFVLLKVYFNKVKSLIKHVFRSSVILAEDVRSHIDCLFVDLFVFRHRLCVCVLP